MYHAEFRDPRLVPVYDAMCPWSREDEFFLSIVNETPGARVLDLGCGSRSAIVPHASFDVAVMTSHVAQFFVGDDEWTSVLADRKRARF